MWQNSSLIHFNWSWYYFLKILIGFFIHFCTVQSNPKSFSRTSATGQSTQRSWAKTLHWIYRLWAGMWKPTLLVCGFFWPLCTFHPHNHRSQRLKNQQSKPLHKTSQILVWNTGESRVKFTKLWISDRFLKILSSLSWKALIVTCDAFRVCCGLVAICLNDTNWNNLLAWKTNKPVSQCKWSKGFINPWPGGVSPSVRGLVWRFLFGMYPCSSTALERSLLQEQLVVRYRVMKRTWQRFLPSAVRMHLNGTDGKSRNSVTIKHISWLLLHCLLSFLRCLIMWSHLLSSWVGGSSQVLWPEAGTGPATDPGPVRGGQGQTGLLGASGTG